MHVDFAVDSVCFPRYTASMPERFPYIESIKVKEVRHLKGFTIDIKDKTHPTGDPVHLMLTGRNGIGKTSLLNAAFDSLLALSASTAPISKLEQILQFKRDELSSAYSVSIAKAEEVKREIRYYEEELAKLCGAVELICYDSDYLHAQLYGAKDMLVAFYDALRTPTFNQPNAPINPAVGFDGNLSEKKSKVFIEYLAHLKVQRSLCRDEGKHEQAEAIDVWFKAFTDILRQIFCDDELMLQFEPFDYTFTIASKGKQSPLSCLADGHAALLDIVADLILKMQKGGAPTAIFDRPGIVFIDEIETHLHLELQRLVMPILTSVFPKIQFIITTHSPFVLSSIGNTVVYDLEKKEAMDNADVYSYNSLAEGFFGVSGQPGSIQRNYNRLKKLAELSHRTEEEENELRDILDEFKEILPERNPQLYAAVCQLILIHHL